MMRFRYAVALALLVHPGADALRAQTGNLRVNGDPAPLTISQATAGTDPVKAVDATTSYTVDGITTPNQRILARLDSPLPRGLRLTVMLQAPGGGSAGEVELTTADRIVVTALPADGVTHANLAITYCLYATAEARVSMPPPVLVTFTLAPGL